MTVRIRHSFVLAVAVLSAGALLWSGCATDEPSDRRAALQRLVSAVRLEPRPGEGAVEITEVASKSDAPYYVADGTLPGTRQGVVKRVEGALRTDGWGVRRSRPVDYPLGWAILGVKETMVTRVLVGWFDAPRGAFNPFPRLAERMWVAISVGRKGSNQRWTQVD